MKLDRRILSYLFIGVDIDQFYYRIAVFIIVTFYLRNTIYTYGMQKNVVLFLTSKEKKARASSICKRFLFSESNDLPKVATPKGC